MTLKTKLRATAGTLCAVGLAAGFALPAAAADFTLKIAHVVPQGDPRDTAARHVAELMNASETCSMEAEVFPAAQLGSTTDLIEGMQIGSIEAVVLPASFLVGFQPLMGLFDFPYFWPTELDKLIELHNSDAVRELLDTTNEQGVYSMAVWHTGYKQWTANSALVEPSDYEGKRARVMPSAILVEQQRALGLTPVDMPFPETYSALQSGAIDAQENPVPTSYSMRFHEVQSHLIMTNHGNLDQIFMVSSAWWDTLTPECQSELTEAVASGQEVVIAETQRVEEEAMDAFTAQGMEIITLTDEQLAALRDRTLPPVREHFVQRSGERGAQILEAIEAEIERL
jgi:tripartite ATP-independent transporter DctP family solute receptor